MGTAILATIVFQPPGLPQPLLFLEETFNQSPTGAVWVFSAIFLGAKALIIQPLLALRDPVGLVELQRYRRQRASTFTFLIACAVVPAVERTFVAYAPPNAAIFYPTLIVAEVLGHRLALAVVPKGTDPDDKRQEGGETAGVGSR